MSSLPPHLSENTARGVVPGHPIAQFEIGDMKNFVYLLIDWETRECAIIDPHTEFSIIENAIAENGLQPSTILLTHTHHDHVGGIGPALERFPGLSVCLNELDLHRLKEPIRKKAKFRFLKDGDTLSIGKIHVEVLQTPGHSPGEVCYFIPQTKPETAPCLFTGDTIFIRDCGRTDFAGGNTLDMFDSIQRIKTLPANTVILCGHHYKPEVASTLAVEMVDSPPFRCRNAAELEALP